MASNIPRVAVAALAERLRVTGLTVDGRPAPQLWADWLANDLDQLSATVHRETLILGESFAIVWANGAGDPLVSIESAHQVAVERDPATRQVVAAVKRWTTGTPDQPTGTAVVLYTPDQIVRMHSARSGRPPDSSRPRCWPIRSGRFPWCRSPPQTGSWATR